MSGKHTRIEEQVVIRRLDPSDPRNLSHPCHKEQFRELAMEIARWLARKQYREDCANEAKNRSDLCAIQLEHAKGPEHC
jgi:hypothetical protein